MLNATELREEKGCLRECAIDLGWCFEIDKRRYVDGITLMRLAREVWSKPFHRSLSSFTGGLIEYCERKRAL